MSNVVRCGLVQTKNDICTKGNGADKATIEKIKQSMLEKHLKYTEDAAKQGVKMPTPEA